MYNVYKFSRFWDCLLDPEESEMILIFLNLFLCKLNFLEIILHNEKKGKLIENKFRYIINIDI